MENTPLLIETRAFICANCGAVSLSPDGVCKIQGMGTKADWCGSKTLGPPKFCWNKVHNLRYVCKKCGKIAVHPGLLSEPEEMPAP